MDLLRVFPRPRHPVGWEEPMQQVAKHSQGGAKRRSWWCCSHSRWQHKQPCWAQLSSAIILLIAGAHHRFKTLTHAWLKAETATCGKWMFPVLHYVRERSPHHRNSCTRMLCGSACLGSGDVKSQHTANKAAASSACSLSSQLPSRLLLCWVCSWETCLSACLPTCQSQKPGLENTTSRNHRVSDISNLQCY